MIDVWNGGRGGEESISLLTLNYATYYGKPGPSLFPSSYATKLYVSIITYQNILYTSCYTEQYVITISIS